MALCFAYRRSVVKAEEKRRQTGYLWQIKSYKQPVRVCQFQIGVYQQPQLQRKRLIKTLISLRSALMTG
jgi:hypothetical protein